MHQPDARLDLIAMLSARSGATQELDATLRQELLGGNRGRMRVLVGMTLSPGSLEMDC